MLPTTCLVLAWTTSLIPLTAPNFTAATGAEHSVTTDTANTSTSIEECGAAGLAMALRLTPYVLASTGLDESGSSAALGRLGVPTSARSTWQTERRSLEFLARQVRELRQSRSAARSNAAWRSLNQDLRQAEADLAAQRRATRVAANALTNAVLAQDEVATTTVAKIAESLSTTSGLPPEAVFADLHPATLMLLDERVLHRRHRSRLTGTSEVPDTLQRAVESDTRVANARLNVRALISGVNRSFNAARCAK